MIDDVIKSTIKEFCLEFLQSPYLCYTEHGLHARFYSKLYSNIPEDKRYIIWDGKKVCIIQKEYPTAHDLGKPKRQHWDISIIQSPPKAVPDKQPSYDYLFLNSVIEFGMNESEKHLIEDIRRLSHPQSNVKNKYIVHLYRISDMVSGRDWSPKSKQIMTTNEILNQVKGTEIEIYYGLTDLTENYESRLWQICDERVTKIE